jgi:hypothetical protein
MEIIVLNLNLLFLFTFEINNIKIDYFLFLLVSILSWPVHLIGVFN